MNRDAIYKKALAAHKRSRGKLAVVSKLPLKNKADLAIAYTPGVAAVSQHLAKKPGDTHLYTMRGNSVAVISDGSAVLGLGNLGPEGALPVMEGKAALFKAFAHIDSLPIVLSTQDTDEIIRTIIAIAPSFGGIILEDISSPRCFEIEERLKQALTIPVMHDDQHGTAIVVLAGLINAARVTKRSLAKSKIVVIGCGAAGTAVAKLLLLYGVKNVLVLDRDGIIYKNRPGLSGHKVHLAHITNPERISGSTHEALTGADAVIGVSGPDRLTAHDIGLMAKNPIVFALANPTPEIMPADALKGGAVIVATGRSDFPNQINNVLAFPGIFRGALDHKVRTITDAMKLRAAEKIAKLVTTPRPDFIVPDIFDTRIVKAVASTIR